MPIRSTLLLGTFSRAGSGGGAPWPRAAAHIPPPPPRRWRWLLAGQPPSGLTVHVQADLGVLALGAVRLVHGDAAQRPPVQVPVGVDAHVRRGHVQAVVVLLRGVRLVGLARDVLRACADRKGGCVSTTKYKTHWQNI